MAQPTAEQTKAFNQRQGELQVILNNDKTRAGALRGVAAPLAGFIGGGISLYYAFATTAAVLTIPAWAVAAVATVAVVGLALYGAHRFDRAAGKIQDKINANKRNGPTATLQ